MPSVCSLFIFAYVWTRKEGGREGGEGGREGAITSRIAYVSTETTK